MKTRLLFCWLLALCPFVPLTLCPSVRAQPKPAPEVDADAVRRMGDTVQYMGAGIGEVDPDVDAFVAVMGAVPEDDNHKWFVTVWTQPNCPPCQRLKKDFGTNEKLLSLAKPDDAAQSWSHFHVYDRTDKTQNFRLDQINATLKAAGQKPIDGFPTIVVQPPLNKRWGDPATLVLVKPGYNGKPDELFEAIVDAVRLYTKKYIEKHPEALEAPPARASGYGQKGIEPPFSIKPKVEVQLPFEIPPPSARAASVDELKAACPGASNEFLLAQMTAKATIDQARAAWAAEAAKAESEKRAVELEAQTASLKSAIEEVKAAATTKPAEPMPAIPWAAVFALITTGSLASILVVGDYGLKTVLWIRGKRKAAGQKLLIGDDAAAMLSQAGELLEALKAKGIVP